VSPDGKEVVAFGLAVGYRRYPVAGGDGEKIPALSTIDEVIRWSTDGRALFISRITSQTADRVDLATGRREPFLTFGPTHSRFTRIPFAAMADDPHVYAYVALPYLSQLFTVDGAR
jgi:hypothetical protein